MRNREAAREDSNAPFTQRTQHDNSTNAERHDRPQRRYQHHHGIEMEKIRTHRYHREEYA
jgi:hypothetical protein